MSKTKILLTGSTGYVGGRLLKKLEENDEYKIKCLVRRVSRFNREHNDRVSLVLGDLLKPKSLVKAFQDIDVAFYMVHFLTSSDNFENLEIQAAQNFAVTAKIAGIKRIIYLSGLGQGKNLSKHLQTRHKTGKILRESGIEVIELRAGIIIGSGSLSFEMIRSLVNHLPVMVTPQWVYTKTSPIAIEDVIEYLLQSINLKIKSSTIYEIGCRELVSYRDLMVEYAIQKKLNRKLIPVPVLTPHLSSLWLGLVTPLYASVGKKLIEGLKNETVVHDKSALSDFKIDPKSYKQAIKRALENEDRKFAATRWSDALSSKPYRISWAGIHFGSRLLDSHQTVIECKAESVFKVISRIGGENGWYFATWMWRFRGFLDLLLNGVGYRRGRRDPNNLIEGDTLDFWRIERVVANKQVLLFAEMKVPGRAWLQFELEEKKGRTELRQTAIFDPAGIIGVIYWYLMYPLHQIVFKGLLKRIGELSKFVESFHK